MPSLALREAPQQSGYGNRCRCSKGPGRLEIIGAVRAIARPAIQIAARTIACLEFDMISPRGDGADNQRERSIAVKVGCDNAEFDRCRGCGYTLPCERLAGTPSLVNRKLPEGRGKRFTEGHDSDLIELTGHRTD